MQHIVFNFIQTITSNLTFIDFLDSEIKGSIDAQIHKFIFWIPVIPLNLIWRLLVWIPCPVWKSPFIERRSEVWITF